MYLLIRVSYQAPGPVSELAPLSANRRAALLPRGPTHRQGQLGNYQYRIAAVCCFFFWCYFAISPLKLGDFLLFSLSFSFSFLFLPLLLLSISLSTFASSVVLRFSHILYFNLHPIPSSQLQLSFLQPKKNPVKMKFSVAAVAAFAAFAAAANTSLTPEQQCASQCMYQRSSPFVVQQEHLFEEGPVIL